MASHFPAPSSAQSYPAKPVRYIVPFPAAGSPDIVARQIAERLGRIWNQQVVVDNRSGAGGTVGAAFAAKAPRGRIHVVSVQYCVERDRRVFIYDDAVQPPA